MTFCKLRIFPIPFPLNGYNGGAAERCKRYPPSDPHLVLLVHAGAATTPARGGSALMAVSLLLSGPSRLETKVPMPTSANPSANHHLRPLPRRLAGNSLLHEIRDGCPPVRYQTCVDLSRTETRQHCGVRDEIFLEMTQHSSISCRQSSVHRPSIKSSYPAALIPGLSMGMKFARRPDSLWDMCSDKNQHPALSV